MLGALILASGILSTVDVGARAEMRLRVAPAVLPQGGLGPASTGVDILLAPYARFEAKTRHVDFKIGYAALVTQADVETFFQGYPTPPQLFQMADTSFWYSSKHWVVGASEAGAYGQMNFSYLTPYPVTPGQPGAPQTPPPVQLVPCTSPLYCANETVNFGASASAIAARYTMRHTTFSIAPSYSISGGTDTASRNQVPDVSMPRIDAALEHQVSRRDFLVTEAEATAATSTIRPCNKTNGGPAPLLADGTIDPDPAVCTPAEQWVALREVWRHRITRRILSEVAAGAMVARVSYNDTDDLSHGNPKNPFNVFPYPVARVVFTYTLQNPDPDRPSLHRVLTDPPKPSAYAYARVGPVVDTHYGFFDPRFEVGIAALQPIDDLHTIQAHAAFVRSLPPTVLDGTFFSADVQVTRRLDKYRFELGGGVRGAYQRDDFLGEFYVFSAYVVLLWHEPRVVL